MTEEELYEGFGLEIPTEAEPEAEEVPQDETLSETAETEATDGARQEEPKEAVLPKRETETQSTSPREHQSKKAVSQKEQEAIDRAYAAAYAGRVNPYTGQAIKSAADYQQFQVDSERYQKTNLKDELNRAGLTAEAIQQVVDQHPIVQRAKVAIKQAEAEQAKAREIEARSWYEEQLKAINTLDPEAKLTGLEELAQKDREAYDKMLAHVRAGVSLADAYKLQNFDRLTKRAATVAKQAQKNRDAGKGHLRQVGTVGAGSATDVPTEVRKHWKELMPDITDEQIRREYAKYQKESGD